MSTGDSKAQQEHARENAQINKKFGEDIKQAQNDQIIVDKKLEGPNRPSE